jgi:hypothetical protein
MGIPNRKIPRTAQVQGRTMVATKEQENYSKKQQPATSESMNQQSQGYGTKGKRGTNNRPCVGRSIKNRSSPHKAMAGGEPR